MMQWVEKRDFLNFFAGWITLISLRWLAYADWFTYAGVKWKQIVVHFSAHFSNGIDDNVDW